MTLPAPFDGVRAEGWRGPNERHVCRWCGDEVPERKRSWCGPDCTRAYLDVLYANDFRYLRPRVYERDGGLCQICGCDPEVLKQGVLDASRIAAAAVRFKELGYGPDDRAAWKKDVRRVEEARAAAERETRALLPAGFPEDISRDWWECDHIVPRVKGGKDCMENLRVLCVPCHKGETAALAARLAACRREAKLAEKRAAWDRVAREASA